MGKHGQFAASQAAMLGRDRELLAILLIGSSRTGMLQLESFIRAGWAWRSAGSGVLLGLLLAWWATACASPGQVRELAEAAGVVGRSGNWNTRVEVRSRDEIRRVGPGVQSDDGSPDRAARASCSIGARSCMAGSWRDSSRTS